MSNSINSVHHPRAPFCECVHGASVDNDEGDDSDADNDEDGHVDEDDDEDDDNDDDDDDDEDDDDDDDEDRDKIISSGSVCSRREHEPIALCWVLGVQNHDDMSSQSTEIFGDADNDGDRNSVDTSVSVWSSFVSETLFAGV